MQIPDNPFSFKLGFLRQLQPGVRQQSGAEPEVKPQVQAVAAGASEPARPAGPAAKSPSSAGTVGLSTATTLDEAVRALRADDRLPRRGSLLDLRA